jgi:hypothetical protein
MYRAMDDSTFLHPANGDNDQAATETELPAEARFPR